MSEMMREAVGTASLAMWSRRPATTASRYRPGPAASSVRGFRRAAREGHVERVGLAVVLEHVLLEVVEEDDGLHLVRPDAAAGRVADVDRRGARRIDEPIAAAPDAVRCRREEGDGVRIGRRELVIG